MKKEWTQLWLDYRTKAENDNKCLVNTIAVKGFDDTHRVIKSAVNELQKGISKMFGISPSVSSDTEGGIVIQKDSSVKAEGYRLCGSAQGVCLAASDEKGVLYGAFHILRVIATEESLKDLHTT